MLNERTDGTLSWGAADVAFLAADTSWYPSEYYIQPHYKTMPERIRFEDTIAPRLTPRRLDFWRRAREVGLAEWAALGVRFVVRERTEYANAPNRVTLAFAGDVPPNLGAWHWFEDPSVGPVGDGHDWIHFLPAWFESAFQSRVLGPTVYRVAHEFGHSLGFGHGGVGIMDQTPDHARVNEEELAAARAYWGL